MHVWLSACIGPMSGKVLWCWTRRPTLMIRLEQLCIYIASRHICIPLKLCLCLTEFVFGLVSKKCVPKLVTYFNLSASHCRTSEVRKVYQEFSRGWKKRVAAAGSDGGREKKVGLNEVMRCETKSTTSKRWWSVGSSWHHMTRFCLINEGFISFPVTDQETALITDVCRTNSSYSGSPPSTPSRLQIHTKLCVIVALYTRDEWEQRAAFQFQGQSKEKKEIKKEKVWLGCDWSVTGLYFRASVRWIIIISSAWFSPRTRLLASAARGSLISRAPRV